MVDTRHASAKQPVYRGRFAPSPTGPLHFGSLIALVGSYLDARSRKGEWLVRMEDLDRPREVAGAADHILRTMEQLGFEWDGPVLYQSQREAAYRDALGQLELRGLIYPCGCSRREIARRGATGIDGPVYPGTCRNGRREGAAGRSRRVRTDNRTITFRDLLQGAISQHLESEIGDFITRRSNGLFAYQLAVVVDDGAQEITHVVRGSDLLISTPRQIYLQRLLGLPTPEYLHLPVAVHADGTKLSKQTRAAAIEGMQAEPWLLASLEFLGQQPPAELQYAASREILCWAVAHWDRRKIPVRQTLPAGQVAAIPGTSRSVVG